MKRGTTGTGTACTSYKNLFEGTKQRSKENYYSEKLLRFKYN